MYTLKEVEDRANQLLEQHELVDWTFRFDKARSRFGACWYGLKQITLSKTLTELNLGENSHHIENTILHEIAHALAGRGSGHGYIWQSVAKSIGCDGDRCYSSDVVKPKPKYKCVCSHCGNTTYKNIKGRDRACGKCCRAYNNGKWSDKYLIVYSDNK